jgi:hypothetical protein
LPVADGLDFIQYRYVEAAGRAGDDEAIEALQDRLSVGARPGDRGRRAAVLSAVLAAGGE